MCWSKIHTYTYFCDMLIHSLINDNKVAVYIKVYMFSVMKSDILKRIRGLTCKVNCKICYCKGKYLRWSTDVKQRVSCHGSCMDCALQISTASECLSRMNGHPRARVSISLPFNLYNKRNLSTSVMNII